MLRLRQIALVARELRPVERALIDAFDLEVCFRDPGIATFGLRHGLYAIGDRILEVVVPKEEGTTAGRYLDRRGGDGGYMVLVQVDDVEANRARLAGTDFRIVYEAKGDGITGLHLHPADVGGAILSIDQADPPESWGWAGRDFAYHSASSVVSDLVGVEFQAEDPAAMAERWGRAIDRPVNGDGQIDLDDAVLRFVPIGDGAEAGRGDGLAAADLVAIDRSRVGETVEVCGTRFNLV